MGSWGLIHLLDFNIVTEAQGICSLRQFVACSSATPPAMVTATRNSEGTDMTNFTDLFFRAHLTFPDATQAIFEFPNGYSISVITGKCAYTTESRPYEAAIFLNGGLCYDTPITDDVLGHQTADDISEIMALIEALPKP